MTMMWDQLTLCTFKTVVSKCPIGFHRFSSTSDPSSHSHCFGAIETKSMTSASTPRLIETSKKRLLRLCWNRVLPFIWLLSTLQREWLSASLCTFTASPANLWTWSWKKSATIGSSLVWSFPYISSTLSTKQAKSRTHSYLETILITSTMPYW